MTGAWNALGSTVGALLLAFLAGHYGLPWIETLFSNIVASASWIQVSQLLERLGLFFLLGYSTTPLPPHPAVILSGLAEIDMPAIGLSMFDGRLLKLLIMAYAGGLKKLLRAKDELKDVGLLEGSNPSHH